MVAHFLEGEGREVGCAMSEPARLALLLAHGTDGLYDDPELTRIAAFAAKLCDVPIALVSMVEEERQTFIARTGLEAHSTPRSQSFCQYAMRGGDVMEVRDARADPAFEDNPLVTGEPFIRFYAGAPLRSVEGAPLGALCVISPEPREGGLSDFQKEGLRVLAHAVVRRLDDRRSRGEFRDALDESQRRFSALADAIPAIAWSTDGAGLADYFNARWYEYVGGSEGEHDGDNWQLSIHPDDREETRTGWESAVIRRTMFEVEYRLRAADGRYRWFLARGLPMIGADGTITRWFGTCTDIHERRQLLEARDLLSRELSHRIKNIFSVMSGLIHLETRARPELKEAATALSERIQALGRAHDYVRPHDGETEKERTLHGVLAELFAPYDRDGISRVSIEGHDIALNDKAATPLALLFHELATNAVKYGALGKTDGKVRLDIRRANDRMVLYWHERGVGAPAAKPSAGDGFGSQLMEMSVTHQLRGRIKRRFDDLGFHAIIDLPIKGLVE